MELTNKEKQTLNYSTREIDGSTRAGDLLETLSGEINGVVEDVSGLEEDVSGLDFGIQYDDIRINPGSFDRPGNSDPVMVSVTPGGSGTATFLYEWAKNDIACFTLQLPHSYKLGEEIQVHIHWTPGSRGNEENNKAVGWKVDATWANIDGTFGPMASFDLSDVCDGVDWKHQMTPSGALTGTDKDISSMLLCNIKRTDTGTDDTWVGTASGQLPLLLEVDFHFPMDTVGSSDWGSK